MGKMEADGKRQASENAAASSAIRGLFRDPPGTEEMELPAISVEGGGTTSGWQPGQSNSLLERSAVWTWSQTDQRRCGKKEKQIKPSGRRHGRSSTAHFKSLVQHSASSSSSSLLSSHSWASAISISAAQARQPSKKEKVLRKAKKYLRFLASAFESVQDSTSTSTSAEVCICQVKQISILMASQLHLTLGSSGTGGAEDTDVNYELHGPRRE